MSPLLQIQLDSQGDQPLYRQLAAKIHLLVAEGELQRGDRLPATRELAGQLGLNRTTVSAAYAFLEQSGLLQGQVGRGSFIAAPRTVGKKEIGTAGPVDWDVLLRMEGGVRTIAATVAVEISFASSRPPADDFPLPAFRRLAAEVIEGPEVTEVLQLGSPYGYRALRHYLLGQAQKDGIARSGDDVLITNGCQQALDLLSRIVPADGEHAIAMEDPVYHGLLRVLRRWGGETLPVPVDEGGISIDALEKAMGERRPRFLIVTPSFQNPTGTTLSLSRRQAVVDLARRYGTVLVENDIYSELRYEGAALPTLKELDGTGNTILLRSYSKIAFPGLRVGWVIAPKPVVARLAEEKQWTDLHSDHLAQAILLRFAESGELAQHLQKTCSEGKNRLDTILEACPEAMPSGTRWTYPQGGMSMWLELPEPLRAVTLLDRARERGVDFLPGSFFSAGETSGRCLRLSFGGLSPHKIRRGIHVLGEAARRELADAAATANFEPAMALV